MCLQPTNRNEHHNQGPSLIQEYLAHDVRLN